MIGAVIKILWASPLPPVKSGVSDYSAELLEEMRHGASIRLVVPAGETEMAAWARDKGYEVVDPTIEVGENEHLVVHLGNNPYHRWLVPLARRNAVVVLHDIVLHHLLVEMTVAEGDLDAYREALEEAHPEQAAVLSAARRAGLSGQLDAFLFPVLPWFLQGARQVVVHSQWATEVLAKICPQLPCFRLEMPALDPGPMDRSALRKSLGLEPDAIAVMHLGFLTRDKGLEILLQAVAAARRCGAPVQVVTVGEGGMAGEVERAAVVLGIGDCVKTTGWVENEVFPSLPAASDLGVVLRSRSAGETSAAVVRFLACGTPVAVMGRRQFLEWPEQVAFRVTPGIPAVADLTRVLLHTADELKSEAWDRRRMAARAAYESRHRPQDVAKRLVEVLAGVETSPQ